MSIQIHLKSGAILNTKSFDDDRAKPATSAFIGMDDEIVVVIKSEIAALIMDDDAAKVYFGK